MKVSLDSPCLREKVFFLSTEKTSGHLCHHSMLFRGLLSRVYVHLTLPHTARLLQTQVLEDKVTGKKGDLGKKRKKDEESSRTKEREEE